MSGEPIDDEPMFENLRDDDGRVYGHRVRRVGNVHVEIWRMGYNERIVLTDAEAVHPALSMLGFGWCYPRSISLGQITAYVAVWDLDPNDPGKTHPPGPWIKAVHSGVYREPGVGQTGPDGVRVRAT